MPDPIPIVPQSKDDRLAGTLTTASLIHYALQEAQSRFGVRDSAFRLEGYVFDGEFPTLKVNLTSQTLLLNLTGDCENNQVMAIHQSSHEVIHMLAPKGGGRPTNLEEGLATLFSEQFIAATTSATLAEGPLSYKRARDAVAGFINGDDAIIRKLRAIEPTFSSMTPAMLRLANPDCSEELAAFLCDGFQR